MKTLLLALALVAGLTAPASAACTAGTKYMLFTDSRGNLPLPADGTTIWQLLQAECPQSSISVSARGGRGVYAPGVNTSQTVIWDLEWMLNYFHPNFCLLMLGINDKFTHTPEAVADGTKMLGDICLAYGATPIIVTGTPVANANVLGQGAWAATLRMRQMEMARAVGWQIIDTYSLWSEIAWYGACTCTSSGCDGVHPYSQTCRQQWADFVAGALP